MFGLVLLALALLAPERSVAQPVLANPEGGLPLLRSFPEGWPVETQVRAIAQGPDGLIYLATPRGVLAYDGVRWERFFIRRNLNTSAVAVGADGRVWAAAQDDLGFFAPDSAGAMAFVSLRDRLPEPERPLRRVDFIVVLDGDVFFGSQDRLLRWREGTGFQAWPLDAGATVSEAAGRLYVHDPTQGLLRLDAERLQPLPAGDTFAGFETASVVAMERGGRTVLVVVTPGGMWTHDGDRFTPWATAMAPALRARGVIPRAARAFGGGLAVGTQRGGVFLLDADGRPVGVLDEPAGLPDPSALATAVDRDGGLWIGTASGVARLDDPGVTRFDGRTGLEGVVLALARHEGQLVAATSTGLFRLEPAAREPRAARFVRAPGATGPCLDLLVLSDGLLTACAGGVDRVGTATAPIPGTAGARVLAHDPRGDRVWVGTNDGRLFALHRAADGWEAGEAVWESEARVLSVFADQDGTVWLGLEGGRVVRLRFPAAGATAGAPPVAERWGEADGLVGTNWVYVWGVGGRPAFGTKTGLYRFEPGRQPAFALDERLGGPLAAGARRFPNVFLLAEAPGGALWIHGDQDIVVARPRDGSYDLDRLPAQHLLPLGSYYTLLVEADGTAWLGGTAGLVRRAPGATRARAPWAARVHRVAAVDADTVLAGGYGPPLLATRLPPDLNALRFEFAAPRFGGTTPLRFRYRLTPLEAEWSAWTEATAKEYTNLPPGRYTFEVQAEDASAQHSDVGQFAFVIAPPWHGTAWARVVFALAALLALAGVVAGGVRWRTRRLSAWARRLEAEVAERTEALRAEKETTERQAERLREQAERLRAMDRLKTRFFTDVSHEFRTPLTLTIGPLEDLIADEALPPEARNAVEMALRNSRRLLRLTNQLLDAARVEAGELKLRARPMDLAADIRALALPFAPLAERRRGTARRGPALSSPSQPCSRSPASWPAACGGGRAGSPPGPAASKPRSPSAPRRSAPRRRPPSGRPSASASRPSASARWTASRRASLRT